MDKVMMKFLMNQKTLSEDMVSDWPALCEMIADECWSIMTDEEKAVAKFGMLPHRVMSEEAIKERHGVKVTGQNATTLALNMYKKAKLVV